MSAGNKNVFQVDIENIRTTYINVCPQDRNICSKITRCFVQLVQFKKREKLSWRTAAFSKVAGFSLQLY